MKGHTGKILRLNLTQKKVSFIETKRYEKWVGGHGIGSAIFWDLVKDKAISGFDPANVVTIMTSPLGGTLTPGASARTEVQGIGVQSYPVEWFTRSNFGGRFGATLKFAGWDGIVIEGRAENPVWVDIRNDEVEIKDAAGLWGKDTYETQEAVWTEVMGSAQSADWRKASDSATGPRTTQKPAVLTIGPAGENLSRTGALIHDAGNAAGQGGFGGVWGSKNLKAISVVGTGSVDIADPAALVDARLWAMNQYDYRMDHESGTRDPRLFMWWEPPQHGRFQGCIGCSEGCRNRSDMGHGNESQCVESIFYSFYDMDKHGGKQTSAAYVATDLLQKYGINAYEAWGGLQYLDGLNKAGILGPGKEIDCDLPFEDLGEISFAERYLEMLVNREGIGDDFAEGFCRASKRWGRLEKDLKTGLLPYPYWGLPEHGYDSRAEVTWGYGTILGDRDVNEHDFNYLYWVPSVQIWAGKTPNPSAEWFAEATSKRLAPFEGDPLMLDYGDDGIYSEHMAKTVAWHRRYSRFWKQSVLYCDYRWPNLVNAKTKDGLGLTGEGEPRFFNAVTGENYTFVEGMELGQKIWNLDNAIWALQGRHRDMVHFSEYVYEVPCPEGLLGGYYLPGRRDGQWEYLRCDGRHLDKARFEDFKTAYYKLEGWDPATGRPTRAALESLGLAHVADALEKDGKLGVAGSKA